MSAVSGTRNSLSVSWTAPNAAGRPAIDDYDLRWSRAARTRPRLAVDRPRLQRHGHHHDDRQARLWQHVPGAGAGRTDEGAGGWSPSGTGSTFANANPVFPANAPTEFTVAETTAPGAAVGPGGRRPRQRPAEVFAGCHVGRGVRHQCQRGDHGDQRERTELRGRGVACAHGVGARRQGHRRQRGRQRDATHALTINVDDRGGAATGAGDTDGDGESTSLSCRGRRRT